MFSDLWRIALNRGQQGQKAHQALDLILGVQMAAAAITAGPRREPKAWKYPLDAYAG